MVGMIVPIGGGDPDQIIQILLWLDAPVQHDQHMGGTIAKNRRNGASAAQRQSPERIKCLEDEGRDRNNFAVDKSIQIGGRPGGRRLAWFSGLACFKMRIQREASIEGPVHSGRQHDLDEYVTTS